MSVEGRLIRIAPKKWDRLDKRDFKKYMPLDKIDKTFFISFEKTK
jgi:hypothetical protein